ncbi:MAG: hypothetical protein JXA20_01545 [Spirochaetes bacterium]|nr:hypothetical protein [Spirochaetota bacterium]
MKLHVKAFCIAAVAVATIPGLILFIWCSVTGFGTEIVRIFESVHPSGGLSILSNINSSFASCIPGIAVNTIYTAADSFIVSILFVTLYNMLVSKFEK